MDSSIKFSIITPTGKYQPDALRRMLNRLTAKLLKKRRYDAIININTLLYCAAKTVGAR